MFQELISLDYKYIAAAYLILQFNNSAVQLSLNWLEMPPWAQAGNVCLNHFHKVRDA